MRERQPCGSEGKSGGWDMVMMVDNKEHSRLHSVEAIITCLLSSNLCNKARKIDYSGGPGCSTWKYMNTGGNPRCWSCGFIKQSHSRLACLEAGDDRLLRFDDKILSSTLLQPHTNVYLQSWSTMVRMIVCFAHSKLLPVPLSVFYCCSLFLTFLMPLFKRLRWPVAFNILLNHFWQLCWR